MSGPVQPIPVLILTGFLGSGKTTLLSQALHDPAMAGTLVIVNELGAVGLDHDLLWSGGQVALSLDNGCICCSVSDDLITMLADLFWKRLHRDIPRFSRVLIETTGIADPRAIVETLRTNPLVAERYRYGGTVTVVDPRAGLERLRRHPEAMAQVAVADRLVLSHADMMTAGRLDTTISALTNINPLAEIATSAKGSAGTAAFFSLADIDKDRPFTPRHHDHHHAHPDVETFAVALREGLDAATIRSGLADMARAGGSALLRAKGMVRTSEGRMLIQMVGSEITSLALMETSVERDSFLVVIGKRLDEMAVRAALASIAIDQ